MPAVICLARVELLNSTSVSSTACKIESRAADDLEHVGGGGLLLQRFPQLVEQPRVLDGDDGLRGEALYELICLSVKEQLLTIDVMIPISSLSLSIGTSRTVLPPSSTVETPRPRLAARRHGNWILAWSFTHPGRRPSPAAARHKRVARCEARRKRKPSPSRSHKMPNKLASQMRVAFSKASPQKHRRQKSPGEAS